MTRAHIAQFRWGSMIFFLVVAVLRTVKGIVEGSVKVELANLREQAIGVVADTYI